MSLHRFRHRQSLADCGLTKMPCFRLITMLAIAFGIGVNAAVSQAFEEVTIKSAGSSDPRSMRMQVLPDGELIAHGLLVIDLISYAYDLPSNPSPRLNSLPDRIYGDRYDIEAKASQNAITTTSQDDKIQLIGGSSASLGASRRLRARDASRPSTHVSLRNDQFEQWPTAPTFSNHRERLPLRYSA